MYYSPQITRSGSMDTLNNKKRKVNLDESNEMLEELKKDKKIPLRSIVKIYCSITEQSYVSPW